MKTLVVALVLLSFTLASIYAGNQSRLDSVVFTSSNLPLILINTHGQTIHNSYRIVADIGIINNSGGQRNFLTDAFTDYDGKISIEIRGSSSTMFEKKSYGFETQDDSGANNNVSLLSMPADNDWILYAPYSDKSLLRNELPYYLARQLGQYASRTAYCELFLNGSYKGIYVLMEKIKRDNNRVDIAKLNPEDITGDELTGGYIIKVDKPYDVGWQVNVIPPSGFDQAYFQYHYPKEDEIVPEQEAYVQNFIFNVESTLVSSNFADTINGYAKYLDVNSFMDHFLIQEFTKCLDSYRFSFYMHKKKDSDGGKLFAGPIWDFDLAFANYGENAWEEPWTVENWNAEIPAWKRIFWMKRLLDDENFVNKLTGRWIEIRNGAFSNSNIMEFIDQTVTRIEEARIRNFIRWPIIGQYVWPNYFVGSTYEDEIDFLKNWILGRLDWMDVALTGTSLPVDENNIQLTYSYLLQQNFPNPFNPTTTINYNILESGNVRLTIFNLLGQQVKTLVESFQSAGEYSIIWNAMDDKNNPVGSGMYFYSLESNNKSFQKKMVLIR
jgi:hypothetical protein